MEIDGRTKENMTFTRRVFRAQVRFARRTERVSGVARSDFSFETPVPAEPASIQVAAAVPYCLDLVHRRSLYVENVDLAELRAAPFSYLYLRRTARTVLLVPWETHLQKVRPTAPDPVLVFSPGRAGSTLLNNIFFEAGIPGVSEPDFYSQAASALFTSPFNPYRGAANRAAHALAQDLGWLLANGETVIAKLRSDCCRAPWALIPGDSAARTIFVTREFETWAASTVRNFRADAVFAVEKYLAALECYAWLDQHSDCHLVRYEALLSSPDQTRRDLEEFLSCKISPGAVARALERDSQEGTPLAQGARPPKSGWQKTLEKAITLWNTAEVRARRKLLSGA